MVEEREKQKLNALAEQVVGAAYEVSNVLGSGFLEEVYEKALAIELQKRGLQATTQTALAVTYKGEAVGDYFADILVEERIIVEFKCVARLSEEHLAQCLNYLKASGLHLAILVNFQSSKVEWRRVVRAL